MKKEGYIPKSKFSFLFYSAFVWGSRTLKAIYRLEKRILSVRVLLHFAVVVTELVRTIYTDGRLESEPSLHRKHTF